MQLPVDLVLPQLVAALRETPCAVLAAPPGAGKTTRAPLALLEAGLPGKIVLLSPRRIAARAAADRMAKTLGERVGETVGYRVRFETKVGPATRIEVVTEGVFTRMILADPELAGIGAVLFDEFHERSLEGDLGLALARDAQRGLREDLRLVVMSATLDTQRVAALLDHAPVIVSQGRTHPVALRYRGRDPRARIEETMAEAVRAALAAESGSILCFLPGAREIERTAERLQDSVRDPAIDIRTLYGALDPRTQDAAIMPAGPGRRKVVLATSIAETSLTIEGVRVVIDSGLARRPRYEVSTGLTRLETGRASRASVEQRAGRAGRTEPGICWRLWDEGETRSLPAYDPPEMLEADLSGLALDLAAWGVSDPAVLDWLDPPPRAAWTQAEALLRELDALDADGRLTPEGRSIAALPLHPRLAHMVSQAAKTGRTRVAARIAMVVSEQGLGGRDIDLRERLRRFEADRSPRAEAARRSADSIARRLGGGDGMLDFTEAGALLAIAFPERVARARGKGGEYAMVNGRGAALDETDPLARSPFLAVAEASGRAERAQILLAAPLNEADIERLFAARIEIAEEANLDLETGRVRARRVRRFGRVILSETPLERPSAEIVQRIFLERLTDKPALEAFLDREPVRQFRARVALMRRLEPQTWPDLDAAMQEAGPHWLAPALDGVDSLNAADDRAVLSAVESLLEYGLRRRLDAEAPPRFETPAGGEPWIDYAVENGPAVEVRLQELFGLAVHPAVAGGRAPLLLRLLSPAGRPVQTTRDLPGFWTGSYAAVRADMRGRYPKHPWPDDPLTAPPTRRAKPRGT